MVYIRKSILVLTALPKGLKTPGVDALWNSAPVFFPLETFGNNANLEIKHFPFGADILYINLKAKRPHYKAKLHSDLYEGLKYLLRQGICWYLVFLLHPGASGLVGSNLTVSGCNEYR